MTRPRPLLVVAATASGAASAAHLLAAGGHAAEWLPHAVALLALGVAQAVAALLLLGLGVRGGSPRAVQGVAVLHVGALALWAVSRTWGMPLIGPHAGQPHSVDRLDVLAAGGAAAVLATLLAASPQLRRAVMAALARAAAATAVLALLPGAIPGRGPLLATVALLAAPCLAAGSTGAAARRVAAWTGAPADDVLARPVLAGLALALAGPLLTVHGLGLPSAVATAAVLLLLGAASVAAPAPGLPGRRGVAMLSAQALLVSGLVTVGTVVTAQPAAAATCTPDSAVRSYDVAAISVPVPYNRWGDVDPQGQVFVLQDDKAAVQHWSRPLAADPALDPAGNRRLRPRPLVLRALPGECVAVTVANELDENPGGGLPKDPRLGLKVFGPSYDVQTSDGSAVGYNDDTTIPNSDDPTTTRVDNRITQAWLVPDREGLYFFRDEAALAGSEADGGSISHGLYGALVVEPAGSTWTDPVSGKPLYTGTGDVSGELYLNADIHVPGRPSFREAVQLSQDEIPGIGFGFNYGAEPQHHRTDNRCPDCIGEETSLSSWTYGDPALVKLASGPGPWLPPAPGVRTDQEGCGLAVSCWTSNVIHSYAKERFKLRYGHAGVKETHVFHLHANQWRVDPDDSGSDVVDSQTYGPGDMFTADLIGGAGSLPGTVGDSIFHCHLYPHFADGFWALLRVHDVREDGTGRTPDGITVNNVQPLPAGAGSSPAPTADNPGYPRWIPGVPGWRAPQPPGSVFAADGAAAERIVAGEPISAAAASLERGVQLRAYGGEEPKPGAPLVDPCPATARVVRYDVAVLQRDLVYNEAGWHDTQGRLLVLTKDVAAVLDGTKKPEPLFIRVNAGDCIDFRLTNLLPNMIGGDAFLKLQQTNMVGGHIHLVKFDVLGSDGASNGWNYQGAAFSKRQAEFNAAVLAGTQQCDPTAGCRVPDDLTYDPTEQYVEQGQTIHERWYADSELRTVFTHDHHFAAVQQNRGLFGALIVEPEGFDTRDRSGAYLQPINDPAHGTVCGSSCTGTAVGEQVDQIGPAPDDDFREYGLALQDFVSLTRAGGDPRVKGDTINPPAAPESFPDADPGVMGINYRNAPLTLREMVKGKPVDPAYRFSSYLFDDPRTPLLEAYERDRVRFRLVQGSHEEQHVFGLNGLSWRQEPGDPNSPVVSSQSVGLSEAFTLRVQDIVCGQGDDEKRCRQDHLYGGNATDDLHLGMWGVFRVYGDKITHQPRGDQLRPLPDNPVADNYATASLRPTHNPPRQADDPGQPCPADAPVRKYGVKAIALRLAYDEAGDHDPFGLVYALEDEVDALRSGSKEPEPLVLRANAGDCVEVKLTNDLPDGGVPHTTGADGDPVLPLDTVGPVGQRVSLHPQLVEVDVRGSDGATVGYNLDQTVGPGETIKYRWYAQPVTPGELGVANLLDFGDVRGHRHHGLFGALVVEPRGSTWTDPMTGTDLYESKRSSAAADIRHPDLPDFREHVLFTQDGLNLRDEAGVPVPDLGEDPEDRGEKGVSYRSEPFRHRLGAEPVLDASLDGQRLARVFSSHIHGDPATPVLRANLGDPLRVRQVQGGDKPRQNSLFLSGHAWLRQPHDPDSLLVASDAGFSVGRTGNWHLPGAGGPEGTAGDYRYGTMNQAHQTSGGLWGLLRVYRPSTTTGPLQSIDDPRVVTSPLRPLGG